MFVVLIGLEIFESNYAFAAVIFAVFITYLVLHPVFNKTFITKGRNTQKHMLEEDRRYVFYETCFETISANSYTKLEYSKLSNIYEGDNFFYIMFTPTQGMLIDKNNCSEELIDFIRKLNK